MKKLSILIIVALINLVLIPLVYAHCPLCTAAVGTGVAITRFYGVDDTIVGIWIGAFVISIALWFNRALKKKHVPLQGLLLIILALIFTVVPFYFAGLINMQDRILGVDKLLFGILSGSLVTYLGLFVSDNIKKKRNKVLFPFQTIVAILIFLTLTSLMFWIMVG